MKKILGVSGSPRKDGNTHILVSRIIEGAEAAGYSGEIVLLGDRLIKECDGCHACWKTGECSKRDDMDELYQKVSHSDVIVFGTPVYWYGPTALMKCFIDRFVYYCCPLNDMKVRDKRAVLAIPYEEDDERMAGQVIRFFEQSMSYLGMHISGILTAPGVTQKGEVRDKKTFMDEAYRLGSTL
jgi:multimeric flavodoxin WrbA